MFQIKKGSRVLIFAKTRMEWMLTALGVMRAGGTVGTLYTTMTQEAITNGLLKFKPDLVVVEAATLARIKEVIEASTSSDQVEACPIVCLDETSTGVSLKDVETSGSKVEVCILTSCTVVWLGLNLVGCSTKGR